MDRHELESQLEEVILESATVSRKDRDRLVENLIDYLSGELGLDLDDEEESSKEKEDE